MEIINKKISELKPYKNNPRNNKEAVKYVANSIKEFGFKVPIIIDKNNEIISGHTRLEASKELGLKEVPCIIANDLSKEQVKAFRLADNKVSEIAEWDFDLLDEELKDITELDMSDFGFDLEFEKIEEEKQDITYTNKIDIPQYRITGEKPKILELVEQEKANKFIDKINKLNISDEEKEFLIKASTRHYAFNYSKIAEYYAHSNKEMQEIMEELALVIIDYDNAIKNGYTLLSKEIDKMSEEDYEE